MKFELDFRVVLDGELIDVATLPSNLDGCRDKLTDVSALLGAICVRLDGEEYGVEQRDPIVRLVDQWVRKIPWVLSGDTETVAYRNSEHCYAFVPAGESVEFSFFAGSENEVEDYVLEPTTVRLDLFANQSIRLAERLVELIRKVDAGLLESAEDCRELVSSLEEGRRAWREHQLHNRR